MRVGDVHVPVRPDRHADRLAGLPLRHLPLGEVLAVAVEVLHAGQAVDDEERVVRSPSRRSPRVDDLPGPVPVSQPDRVGLRPSPQPESDRRRARSIRTNPPQRIAARRPPPPVSRPCHERPRDQPRRDNAQHQHHAHQQQRRLDHGVVAEHVDPGHQHGDERLRPQGRDQHGRGHFRQGQDRHQHRRRPQHRPGERPDDVRRALHGTRAVDGGQLAQLPPRPATTSPPPPAARASRTGRRTPSPRSAARCKSTRGAPRLYSRISAMASNCPPIRNVASASAQRPPRRARTDAANATTAATAAANRRQHAATRPSAAGTCPDVSHDTSGRSCDSSRASDQRNRRHQQCDGHDRPRDHETRPARIQRPRPRPGVEVLRRRQRPRPPRRRRRPEHRDDHQQRQRRRHAPRRPVRRAPAAHPRRPQPTRVAPDIGAVIGLSGDENAPSRRPSAPRSRRR